MNPSMKPTHNCGQLNSADKGSCVLLCGWVRSIREHGKITFVDLRDRYGITQVTTGDVISKEAFEVAGRLRNEFVIAVEGEVNERPSKNKNPNIPTGEIEVSARRIHILNECLELPFPIEDKIEAGEELRMKYRYLDLRRVPMLNNLIVKHKLYQACRNYLSSQGFLEIETPDLTKSTPEGARDFLVLSRLQPPKFYALPQSPQLFKQILMVAGVDKYFQIVRCFRDEDLRGDRQPEFSQLDIELSFVDEEDIFKLIEGLIKTSFKEVLEVDIETPFLRLTYKEAMEKHKTDKPDLKSEKEPFKFLWVVDFPLFKYSEEEGRWVSEHHPFTAPEEEDIEKIRKSPDKILSRSFDIVLNGAEIGSGSIRIHNPELQKQIFDILKISHEEAKERFGFLLQALEFGAPPHGGIALGLDRLLSIVRKTPNIRELIPFPKTQRGICPLTGAPQIVTQEQIKDMGWSPFLEVNKKNPK